LTLVFTEGDVTCPVQAVLKGEVPASIIFQDLIFRLPTGQKVAGLCVGFGFSFYGSNGLGSNDGLELRPSGKRL
jgi:hypothetical protein